MTKKFKKNNKYLTNISIVVNTDFNWIILLNFYFFLELFTFVFITSITKVPLSLPIYIYKLKS